MDDSTFAGLGQCYPTLLDSRRHWSLWDMVANFPFSHVLMVSRELGIMIQVSNRNMKFVEEAGGYNSPRVINDPGAAEAMDGAIRSVELITDWSDKLFSGLKCSHIDGAARRLRAWLKQSQRNGPS